MLRVNMGTRRPWDESKYRRVRGKFATKPKVAEASPRYGRMQPVPASVTRAEEYLVDRDTESLMVFETSGRLKMTIAGTKDHVMVPVEALDAFKDAIVTHNHPNGLSFSNNDCALAARGDVREIRAVGIHRDPDHPPRRVTYRLRSGSDGWPPVEVVWQAMLIADNRVHQRLNQPIRQQEELKRQAIVRGAAPAVIAQHEREWQGLVARANARHQHEALQEFERIINGTGIAPDGTRYTGSVIYEREFHDE